MSDANKSVVLPMFSGKDEHFQVWWTKFRAFATTKGFVKGLKKEADLPDKEDTVLDDSKPDELLKVRARNRNRLGMAYLLSAFKA